MLTVVPYNQPVAALDMLRRFLTNESFIDIEAPLIRYGNYSVANEYLMSNPIIQMEGGNQNDSRVILASTLAFVAGIVCTIVLMKIWNRNQGGEKGKYTRVPDADMNGNGHSK
jgi:hypothetical protein